MMWSSVNRVQWVKSSALRYVNFSLKIFYLEKKILADMGVKYEGVKLNIHVT